VGFVALLNAFVPHEHFVQGRQGPEAGDVARIWLFVLAITIHNIPEGLAVGVGYGGGDVASGTTLAVGIGLQNAPEGLAVALALWSTGYSKLEAFLIASLTGAVEPVAGLFGAYAVSISQLVLPWALTFAAGAMLFVISHEIIPETHKHGFEGEATAGLTIGLAVMMFLDVVFG
jgi:ZIP family zinc transporter